MPKERDIHLALETWDRESGTPQRSLGGVPVLSLPPGPHIPSDPAHLLGPRRVWWSARPLLFSSPSSRNRGPFGNTAVPKSGSPTEQQVGLGQTVPRKRRGQLGLAHPRAAGAPQCVGWEKVKLLADNCDPPRQGLPCPLFG